jgi:hypothetical protein
MHRDAVDCSGDRRRGLVYHRYGDTRRQLSPVVADMPDCVDVLERTAYGVVHINKGRSPAKSGVGSAQGSSCRRRESDTFVLTSS